MSITDNTTALRNLLNLANSLPSADSGPVYGKAVFFGDSISVGTNNNDYSFVDILAESGAFESVTKRAYSGATIGPYSGNSTTNDYCLVNQVNRYQDDIRNADIIFIEYGANDFNAVNAGNVVPGLIADAETVTSITGYARKAFNLIRNLNPKARLIWLAFARWKGEGLHHAYLPTPGLDSYLLYLEASLYRVIDEYGSSIINITDGVEWHELVTNDGVHPTTEGHMMIAQNVLANMFRNTEFPMLVKRVHFAVAEDFTVTTDATLFEVWGLLVSGCVDVYGETSLPGQSGTFPLRCMFYDYDQIGFVGDGIMGGNLVKYGLHWTDSGITLVQNIM